jgi:hypothetical protein
VPIKVTGVNFMELLERNLASMPESGDNPEGNSKKVINKQRFKKVVNVSKPTETKKYKYYSDNFDKDGVQVNVKDNEVVKEIKNYNEKKKQHNKANKDKSPKKETNINVVNTVTNSSLHSNYSSNTGNVSKGITGQTGQKPKKPATLK